MAVDEADAVALADLPVEASAVQTGAEDSVAEVVPEAGLPVVALAVVVVPEAVLQAVPAGVAVVRAAAVVASTPVPSSVDSMPMATG